MEFHGKTDNIKMFYLLDNIIYQMAYPQPMKQTLCPVLYEVNKRYLHSNLRHSLAAFSSDAARP